MHNINKHFPLDIIEILQIEMEELSSCMSELRLLSFVIPVDDDILNFEVRGIQLELVLKSMI